MSTLNFVLSAAAAQGIHNALVCLSKFSEYICLEARCDRFTLSALNSTKSAYGGIALSSECFFESYKFVPQGDDDAEAVDLGASRFTCRLYSKALLAAFRQRYFDTKERGTAIEKCKVSLEDDPSRPECRLLVKLMCGHGVLKTYKLTYEEVEVMAPVFDRDRALNRWTVKARLMKDYMEHFGPKAEGLDITSNNGRAVFTSFTEKVTDGKEILKLPMQTNVVLDTSDFEDWSAEDKVNVAISLKDMKAIILHAATLNTTVSTFYSEAGRPFQVVYECEGMKCEFTLMTMTQTTDYSQTFAAITRVESRPTPRPTSRPAPRPSIPLFRGTLEPEASRHSSTQSLRGPLDEDESLYRQPPTQSFRAQPNASAQRAQQRQTSPQSPSQVLPSQRMTQGLFLPYDSEEDSDDDLGRGLDNWDEPRLRWDSGGNDDDDVMPSISVVRDQIVPGMMRDMEGDATESEGEKEDTGPVVGPTPQVSRASVHSLLV